MEETQLQAGAINRPVGTDKVRIYKFRRSYSIETQGLVETLTRLVDLEFTAALHWPGGPLGIPRVHHDLSEGDVLRASCI